MKHGNVGDLLDADFQQYYGKGFLEFFEENEYRAYMLAGSLPQESRVMEEELGGVHLSHADFMLTNLEFMMQQWMVGHMDEKDRRKAKPEISLPEHYKKIHKYHEEKKPTQKDQASLLRERLSGRKFT